MSAAVTLTDADDSGYDSTKAEQLFQQICSQCHSYTQIENAPPGSRVEATALVQRMVGNGLSTSEVDLNLNTIIHCLNETYANAK